MMKKRVSDIPKDYNTVVLTEKLSSTELFWGDRYDVRRVLRNIDICIKKNEIWGFNGDSLFDLKLLLEIIANIKPYHNGKCVLFEYGMMSRKRIILPHVFYAGTSTMLYNNMNVLEFLMFITANSKKNVVIRQKELFDLLLSLGLGKISLSPIYSLSKEYKSIIILLCGYLSSSELIVFNYPDYIYSKEQVETIYNIIELIKNSDKTPVLSSTDSNIIENICSHTSYLIKGEIVYSGTVDDFRNTYDKIILTIWDRNLEGLLSSLKRTLPQYKYNITDSSLVISGNKSSNYDIKHIYKEIADAGFAPEKVYVNPKTVQNACEEILEKYDLQKQLF